MAAVTSKSVFNLKLPRSVRRMAGKFRLGQTKSFCKLGKRWLALNQSRIGCPSEGQKAPANSGFSGGIVQLRKANPSHDFSQDEPQLFKIMRGQFRHDSIEPRLNITMRKLRMQIRRERIE